MGSVRSTCFCAFFPLTLTVTPSASLLLVLFLFFLPPAALMLPHFRYLVAVVGSPLFYGWFVAGLPSSSGHPVTGVLLQRLASWALQCYFTLCRQCQFLCPSFLISSVLFIRLACGRLLSRCLSSWGVLPCPVGGLDGLVGHLMCCVSLATRFSSLWYCSLPPPCHGSSMCLARQAQVSSSRFTFLVFVSAYLSDLTSRLLFVVSQRCSLLLWCLWVTSFWVRVVFISSRRLGLCFPSGHPSTWLLCLLGVPPPHPPFLGASVALLAPSPLPLSA